MNISNNLYKFNLNIRLSQEDSEQHAQIDHIFSEMKRKQALTICSIGKDLYLVETTKLKMGELFKALCSCMKHGNVYFLSQIPLRE